MVADGCRGFELLWKVLVLVLEYGESTVVVVLVVVLGLVHMPVELVLAYTLVELVLVMEMVEVQVLVCTEVEGLDMVLGQDFVVDVVEGDRVYDEFP